MNDFDQELERRLQTLRDEGLHRELRRIESPQSTRIQAGGRSLVNFSSNDYLGLANNPSVKRAAARAVEQYGAGAGASRLVCGSLAPHHELDEALAAFKGTEAALSFSSGYVAAIGTIGAIARKEDVIILDKLVHASLVDAARLSGAKLRVFAHNDVDDLETILKWACQRVRNADGGPSQPRVLIVTESVFSMNGDLAPLGEIAALKALYGAWLMVDEAHATGLYGLKRRGLAEEMNVSEAVEIQMGTLGKALGAAGGYICGSRKLIDLLVNRARSFIFSTAPVPAAAAAATAAIGIVSSATGEELRTRLWKRTAQVCGALTDPPRKTQNDSAKQQENPRQAARSAIIPILIGDETRATDTASALRESGIWIPAIRYPTVARGSARLRLTLSAAHTDDEVARLLSAFSSLNLSLGAPAPTSAHDAHAG